MGELVKFIDERIAYKDDNSDIVAQCRQIFVPLCLGLGTFVDVINTRERKSQDGAGLVQFFFLYCWKKLNDKIIWKWGSRNKTCLRSFWGHEVIIFGSYKVDQPARCIACKRLVYSSIKQLLHLILFLVCDLRLGRIMASSTEETFRLHCKRWSRRSLCCY